MGGPEHHCLAPTGGGLVAGTIRVACVSTHLLIKFVYLPVCLQGRDWSFLKRDSPCLANKKGVCKDLKGIPSAIACVL